jgi:hypothetical protein
MLSQQEKKELGSYVDALRTMRRAIELKASFALAQDVRVVDLSQATADLGRTYVLLGEDNKPVEKFSSSLRAFGETVQLVEEYFVGLVVKDTEHERLAKEFSSALDSLLEKLAQGVKEVESAH